MFVHYSKIKNSHLEKSKYPKFLYSTRFQYEEFNGNDKSKFKDNLIYFLN
jgi:hypothetical protein